VCNNDVTWHGPPFVWLPQLAHVHDGSLVGNDAACVHADNTNATLCWGQDQDQDQGGRSDARSGPAAAAAAWRNCTKTWHHSWVHDCREKCVRGDDNTYNLSAHHLVRARFVPGVWYNNNVNNQTASRC
jgi:hypothetical protein